MSESPSLLLPRWLRDAVLTVEPLQRVRLRQALLALALMVFSAGLLAYASHLAGTPWTQFALWAALSVGGQGAMFMAIRLGWTLRLRDPALTLPQMLFAVSSGAWAYGLAGPLRGAVFPVLMVVLVFGMFHLRARYVVAASVYALAAFGAVMVWRVGQQARDYPVVVELGHFLVLAGVLPALSLLAARMARLRSSSRHQRRELTLALGRIQELATHDELTGLVNRRHMSTLLEQERQRSLRSGRHFCVAIVDIDHFKAVNDHYGHAVGDEVLCSFARQAPTALRTTDVIARWGGDEFVLLLADVPIASARTGVERLRGRLAATPMAHLDGVPIRCTLSVGVTEHVTSETVQQLLERADRALYQAKSQGRNQAVIA